MIQVRITTLGWNKKYNEVSKKFETEAHLQAYLRKINECPFSKLIGVQTAKPVGREDDLTTTNSN